MKPLKGARVLVTRPAGQAGPLCQLLREQGAQVVQLPLFEIEPLAAPEELRARLAAACGADWWIFTSANAVSAATGLAAADWPARVAAIGPATQARLAALGVNALAPAAQASSQGLLAEPALQALHGQRVVIVTGEHGLGELAPALQARGAQVQTLPVYRRLPLTHGPETVAEALAASEVILLTSGEALDALLRLAPDRATLLAKQLLVPSARVAARARAAGFRPVPWVPQSMSDAACADCLRLHLQPVEKPAMTVPESPVPTPSLTAPAAPPARGDRGFLLLLLLLLALLGAGGWWGYQSWRGYQVQWQDLVRDLNQLEVQTARIESRQADLAQASRRNGQELAALERRVEEYDQSLGELSEQISGGRVRFQLSAVEQLLLLANDRVLLMGDVRSAALALELADQRLATLADPRLFRVREAIARERAALLAVPVADLPATALALSGLVERASGWPLRARVPRQFEVPAGQPAPPPVTEDAGWIARARAALREVMGSVFILRRNEAGSPVRLLSADQEALVHQLLQLKLETARLAFLSRDEPSFRAALRDAAGWLRDYYNGADPGVRVAQAELERLGRLRLAPELPDISRSLTLLRAQLEPAPK